MASITHQMCLRGSAFLQTVYINATHILLALLIHLPRPFRSRSEGCTGMMAVWCGGADLPPPPSARQRARWDTWQHAPAQQRHSCCSANPAAGTRPRLWFVVRIFCFDSPMSLCFYIISPFCYNLLASDNSGEKHFQVEAAPWVRTETEGIQRPNISYFL